MSDVWDTDETPAGEPRSLYIDALDAPPVPRPARFHLPIPEDIKRTIVRDLSAGGVIADSLGDNLKPIDLHYALLEDPEFRSAFNAAYDRSIDAAEETVVTVTDMFAKRQDSIPSYLMDMLEARRKLTTLRRWRRTLQKAGLGDDTLLNDPQPHL